jgi:hypothetical protein
LTNHEARCRGTRPGRTTTNSSRMVSPPTASTPPQPTAQTTPGATEERLAHCLRIIERHKARPLRRAKPALIAPLRSLTIALLRDIVVSQDPRPATVALLGLPRLVHSKDSSAEAFLRDSTASIPASGPVLEALAAWTPHQRPPPRRPLGRALPVRRITELVEANNIGMAVQVVESA